MLNQILEKKKKLCFLLGKFRLFSPDTALWRSGRKTGMGSEN
jgi:hypothetical protein